MHVHVYCPDGEAKFWIEPIVALATNHGLSKRQLTDVQRVVQEKQHEIVKAWRQHFGH